jgi:hypothetical protein
MLVLVELSSTLVLVVVSMVVLVGDVSTKLMLVVELSSTLVLVGSSRLVAVGPVTEDDTFELGVVPREPELGSSLESSPDANATPTRSSAAATAVNTPIIFLNIKDLLFDYWSQCQRCRIIAASGVRQEDLKAVHSSRRIP